MKLKRGIMMMLVSMLLLVLVGCGKSTIEGTWKGTFSNDSEIIFVFEKDGTGVYNQGGIALSSTYRTEGDQLIVTMSFLGQTQEETYTYSLKGKTLTLTTADGETISLDKE